MPLLSLIAALLILSGLFFGATWGIRVGRTEGLATARALTQENWVDLLEVSVNLQQARSVAVDPLAVQAAPKALHPPKT
ncbi:MAG: hypothetical protein F2668_01240 [Actinobacteria bacterium]|nr:hypothetical protein [Actinomycetota bacterium]MSX74560.1 hypothetical protein [Actinomycetota bacterium]MSY21574.1 hypothetical protein [Actinomycetota bacterium]